MKWMWGEALLGYALDEFDKENGRTDYTKFLCDYCDWAKVDPSVDQSDTAAPGLITYAMYKRTQNPEYERLTKKVLDYIKIECFNGKYKRECVMSRGKSQKKEKRKFAKTDSIRSRFLATVILAMLAITTVVGSLSLYEVDNYVQEQSNSMMKIVCDNEAERINNSLLNMEKSVIIMERYLKDFFKSEADVIDKEVQSKAIENADKMFVDVAKHTSTAGAVSFYFRLDPAISDNKAGLFYSKLNGGDELVSVEPTDLYLYDKNDTEHVGWFWEPYEKKEPVWMKPYHNQNNDILMISYVIPMYCGEMFIGVVGMDFDYMALVNQVNEITIYENGFARLELDGAVLSDGASSDANSAVSSREYKHISKDLVNGMELALFVSYDDIRQTRYDIGWQIVCTVVIFSVVFIAIATFVVKKISDPLKNLTDAAAKLSVGDYNVEIKESNAYEIKLLNTAFENMVVCLKEHEENLRLSANRDSMTGLRNTTSYAKWVSRFDKELENSPFDFGVAVFDLNNLKQTNDTYGHAVGNKLIITVAKLISEIFKRSPVFRIGGDEFLVVLQNNDLENYGELSELLISNCRNTFADENKQVPIEVAIGFARYQPYSDTSFVDVFKRADDAMYENKRKMKIKM